MNRKRRFQIERPEPGVLSYREGGTEYRFPVYEQDGEIVYVAWPTSQSIFLFFLSGGWRRVPRQFSDADRERITRRVIQHFCREGRHVRVLSCPSSDEQTLQFHPDLFECRDRAFEILDEAGLVYLSDYCSIDLLHDTYGLEICGITVEAKVEPALEAMKAGFPQWHYKKFCFLRGGHDAGWRFALQMFPRLHHCSGGQCGF
jgi:hypothetical protein